MDMDDKEIKIRFGAKLTNLYDIGYLTTDIQQIVAFSGLLERGDLSSVEKYFGERVKGLNRYARILEESGRKSQVTDVHRGSVELVVAGLTLAASIIVPITIAKAQRRAHEEGLQVVFEINPADQNIRTHIAAYANGRYGQGVAALNELFETLNLLNYNTTLVSENAYRIEHVTDKYAERMVKTIKRV